MSDTDVDFYEVLQISPRADDDTVQRVFRHMAKRFHPDNPDSGDPDRFAVLMEAFRVLSDPQLRAAYDLEYEARRQTRWKIFDQDTAESDVVADRRVQAAILTILYTARRNDSERPGVGIIDLERLTGCPEDHMNFHIWYLKENGWLFRTESGAIAITAIGVDKVLEMGAPRRASQLLEAGKPAGD